jgi:hypothetical protein
MRAIRSAQIILASFIGLALALHSAAYGHVPEHLQHDIETADRIFKTRCTECHSIDTALSIRVSSDWLLGVSQRHGKSYDWISEQEARQIFLHLLVHLEPKVKTIIEEQPLVAKGDWRIFLCLVSGLVTILLLITTLFFGHSRNIRRKWFKGHSYFAVMTLIFAIIHGSYCFYMFVLK